MSPRLDVLLSLLMSMFALACDGPQAQAYQKLGPPEEQALCSIPEDSMFVHEKVSEQANSVAFWVRRPHSVQLIVTGHPAIEFKGYIRFQHGMGTWQAAQPNGDNDVVFLGDSAKKDAWLLWGPGVGNQGESLDTYLVFDRTGNHVAYAAYDKGTWSWVLDGKVLENGHDTRPPVLSDNATTVACVDRKKGDRVILRRSGKAVLALDGTDSEEYDNVRDLQLSPSGDRFAYWAERDGKHCVVLDGKAGPYYESVSALIFSPDGRHFAHRADGEGQAFFVVDGRVEANRFDRVWNRFVFAPVGGRFAYAGVRGKTCFVVIDGQESPGCKSILGMTFSSDGRRFARLEVGDDEKLHIFIDDKERWTHTGQGAEPAFSSDGSRLLYGIVRESKMLVVVDGVEGPKYEAVGSAVFSPDGKHVAYLAKMGDRKEAISLDGKLQQEYSSIAGGPCFTSAGQLVYCGIDADKWFIVVDSTRSESYDRVYIAPSGAMSVRPDGTLEYTGLRGKDVIRVRHRPVKG